MSSNHPDRPNIVLIIGEQQRHDMINVPYVQTPIYDRLASEGVLFEQCYCTAPTCVPSRASFFNLQYSHTLGVYHNHCRWTHSWVERFQDQGYHTVNIGKMHTVPMETPCGFDQRFVVENKDRPLRLNSPHGNAYDEWDKFLNSNGQRKPSREWYRAKHPDWEMGLGAYEWPLEEQYHADAFVGTMAEWFIEQREATSPLFLQIGFLGPHPPYDPPRRLLEMYKNANLPVPEVTDEELAKQPPPQATYRQTTIEGNHDAVRWHEHPTREQLLRLRRHYAANVTLIDEQMGRILLALEHKGYLDNCIIFYIGDHGDCLGDHGLIQKWTMYDCITRVPALAWAPGRLPAGRRVADLIQHIDLAPMLFDLAGVQAPAGAARSALPVALGQGTGREVVFAEHTADNVLKGINFMTMVRTTDWKLVHYVDQPFGEMYDLRNNPEETSNLWADPSSSGAKRELLGLLRDWRARDSLQLLRPE